MALPIIVAVLLLFVRSPKACRRTPALLRYLCRGDRRVDFEPLPGAVIGITGVVVIALCSQWLLFSPDQMAAPASKWLAPPLSGR